MTVRELIKMLEDVDQFTPQGAAIPLPRAVTSMGPSINASTLATRTGGTVTLIIQDDPAPP